MDGIPKNRETVPFQAKIVLLEKQWISSKSVYFSSNASLAYILISKLLIVL
jgi:hypothetical protein